MSDDIDEVALNVLLTETDPATALAGSVKDDPGPQRGLPSWLIIILTLAAVALFFWLQISR